MAGKDTLVNRSSDRCVQRWIAAAALFLASATGGSGQFISFTNIEATAGLPFGQAYTVTLFDVDRGDAGQYKVYVNGVEGTGWGIDCVPPCSQIVNAGAIFQSVPGLMLSVLAELVHVPTGELVHRTKATFVRPRVPYTIPGDPDFSMGMQVTQTGLDELAELLQDILPPDDFGDLVLAASDTTRTLEGGTDPLVCVNLTDLDSSFLDLPGVQEAFNTVTAIATGVYTGYQSAVAAGGMLAGVPFCVRRPLTLLHGNWEVCLDRLEGELVDVDVGGLVDAALLPYDGGTAGGPVSDGLALDADLGDIDLEIDATLADLFFRWKHSPGFCTLRPQRDITSADTEFEEWSTCRGLELDISAPSAKVDGYNMDFVRSTNLEGAAVDGADAVDVRLTGSVDTSTQVGQCSLAAINPLVEDLVGDYLDGLDEALETAWLDGAETAAAEAMNDVLLPLGVGARDTALDVDLVWATQIAEVDSYLDPVRADGFTVDYGPTIAILRPGYAAGPSGTAWDPIAETAINWSEDGRTEGAPPWEVFDLAYTISTSNLNQILLSRAATDLLNFTVPMPPASGASVTSAPGSTALADMMTEPLELRVSPSQQPFTWMIPDPLGPISGVSPVVFHLMRLGADLVRPGTGGADDETLATMELDFVAPRIGITLDNTGSDFLDIVLGATQVDLKVLTSNVPGCPRQVHDSGHPLTCEGLVENLFESLIEPSLVDVMHELLSEVPGPHLFDGDGATTPCAVSDLSTYQSGQRVTVYADLDC